MTDPRHPQPTANRPERSQRWAPWWIYLIVLLGANSIRNHFLPGDALPLPATVGIAIGQAATLFVIVTAIWRLSRRHQD